MEFVFALGPRVLLSDVGAKLDMRADGFSERFIVGQDGLVKRLQVEDHESVALLVGDFRWR